MCGSDAAALERIFNDGRAPMYGRTDEQLRLLPFELVRSAEELHESPSLGIFDPKTSKEPPWFLFSCPLQV